MFRTLILTVALSNVLMTAVSHAGYKPEENYYGTEDDSTPPDSVVRKKHGRRHAAGPHYCCGVYRFVYAESWYGFKHVAAPVRHAEHGDEVRLPGGTWVYCEFTCEYTLRKQSLDFWDGVTGQGQNVSPGLFRKEIDLDDPRIRHW